MLRRPGPRGSVGLGRGLCATSTGISSLIGISFRKSGWPLCEEKVEVGGKYPSQLAAVSSGQRREGVL